MQPIRPLRTDPDPLPTGPNKTILPSNTPYMVAGFGADAWPVLARRMTGVSKTLFASQYPASRGVDTMEASAACGIRPLSRVVPAMTSITIPLSDERAAQLRVWAEEAGLPPEEFLRRRVEQLLDRPDQQIQKATDYLLQKNAELYRRLA